jgi:23S rRNA (guanosine2251-2'-O)-methyltransferase
VESAIVGLMTFHNSDVRLILDNIRSVHNVGSIFRTADTLGISHIYCIGTTPVPIDRFGRKRKDFVKVALGAEETVGWEHVNDADSEELIMQLKKEDFEAIALEQSPRAVDYKKVEIAPGTPTLIILGNEVEGVSHTLLNLADTIAEIPVNGKKESLNVSVATAVFLYRLLDA